MSDIRNYDTVDAEVFRVLDRQGRPRALLHAMGGDVTLDLLGEDELPRITIGVYKDRPSVSLLRSDGNAIVSLGLSPEGATGISLARHDGTLQMLLTVNPDGKVEIIAFNPEGERLWSLPPS
ncbi:MAG TPA: hypothetical protein VMF30_17400 [Pirellulales bacterium]|nr:hypothetical protein [Pirellulales bacterium]